MWLFQPIKDKTFAEYTCLDGRASAFIIIQNDTIKYEHYNGWLKKLGHSNIFSVSKSITALMCGIAVKEGKIRSIDDYVTDYVPELRNADEHFQQLTIRHLLNSRSLKTIFQHKACIDKLYADSFYKVQKNSHSSFEVICCRS